MDARPKSRWSADQPLEDVKDDHLGYAPFARTLAASISEMTPEAAFVMAVYGPWGSGKSTLMNFIVQYMMERPPAEQPLVIRFNPWWFSGEADLTKRFLNQVLAVLGDWDGAPKSLKEKIAAFAVQMSEVPTAGTWDKWKARIGKSKEPDLPALKRQIAEELVSLNKRILVLIDDIDRLDASEIRHLFRIVKAIADFPGIIYFLTFDKEVAMKAVEKIHRVSGSAYLEKIVQAPFELPLPDRSSLRQMLFNRVNRITAGTPPELFDKGYWNAVYLEGIDPFIAVPRDIIQLTNALSVTYSVVRGEVNLVDFLAMETLRVFSPPAYYIMRRNPSEFVGPPEREAVEGAAGKALKEFHEAWLATVEEHHRRHVKRLMVKLFPKLGAVWGQAHLDPDWNARWRKLRRVCHPEVFPVYFKMALPEGGLSNVEIRVMMTLTEDAKSFGAKLVSFSNERRADGTTRLRAFLEQFQDYTEKEIPAERIPAVIEALLDVGDRLLKPEDEPKGEFGYGNDVRIGRVVSQLLRRLEPEARFEALRKAAEGARSIYVVVREVGRLGGPSEEGEGSDEEPLLTKEQARALQAIALEKIREAAEKGVLMLKTHLRTLFARWRDWGEPEEVRTWLAKELEEDMSLARVLEEFLSVRTADSGKQEARLDPRWLEPYLDPARIAERARTLASGANLTGQQRRAAARFVEEFDRLRQGASS